MEKKNFNFSSYQISIEYSSSPKKFFFKFMELIKNILALKNRVFFRPIKLS